MPVALIVLATLLGLAAAGSAFGKLKRVPSVVASMHAVGVSDGQMRILATLELLGAAGLLVGIWVPFLGIAAAICLALYFLGAVIAHVRSAEPAKTAVAPVLLMILAIATAALELAR
ncbi:MAG: DoxX family protein [Actinobacteria bacterium]|nr:DoxX family protein [Actinomycetota bacterium]